jgi:hypothetical protein
MKRRFFDTAKKNGAAISGYETYRSDMGCQVYSILYSINGKTRRFDDSYFPGEIGSKDKVISEFEFELKKQTV